MTMRSIADALAFAFAFSFTMYQASQAPPRHPVKPQHAIERSSPPESKPIYGWRTRAMQEKFLPPEQYRHYDGPYKVSRASIDWISTLCQDSLKKSGASRALGCSFKYPKKCEILIATDEELEERGWDYSIVLAHELGHCAGWRHDY
jgi:hypothetical protein